MTVTAIATIACSGSSGGTGNGADDPNDGLSLCEASVLPPVPIPTPGCAGQSAEVTWIAESGVDYDVEYSSNGDAWTDAEHIDAEEGLARADGIGTAGTYFWRIRGIHGDCRTEFSPAIPFEVAAVPDVPSIAAEDVCEGDPLIVTWAPVEGVDVVIEYEAADGAWQPGTDAGPGRAELHDLAAGTYDLRATATLALCSESTPEAEQITAAVEPDPTTPTDLTDDGPVQTDGTVELSWTGPMTGTYEVTITAQDGTTWMETQPGADGTQLSFRFPASECIRPGDYEWSVRHVTPCGVSSPSDATFTVVTAGSVTSWTRHDTGVDPSIRRSLWGSGDEVWNVGTRTADGADVVTHWDGSTWITEELPAGYESVHGTAPDDVWMVGWEGPALHYDGSTWTEKGPELDGIWAVAPDDVWALPRDDPGNLIHYDGTAWSPFVVDYATNGPLSSPSLTQAFTVLGDTLYVAVSNNAGSPSPGRIENGVWSEHGDTIYAFYWDLLVLADDAIWWVGGINPGTVVFWDGSRWVEESAGFYSAQGIDGTSPDNVWGAGWLSGGGGALRRRDCEGWQIVSFPDDINPRVTLDKVWLEVGTDVWVSGHEVVMQGHVTR